MNQQQLATRLNISKSKVGRYTKGLLYYNPNLVRRMGKIIFYDEKAFRAIQYMSTLVPRGIYIKEAAITVLKDIYHIDIEYNETKGCEHCAKLEEQLALCNEIIKQQTATITILTEKFSEI